MVSVPVGAGVVTLLAPLGSDKGAKLKVRLASIEELPSDDEPPDLAGTGANLIKLCVSQQAPRGVLVDVTVPPQDLNRVQGHASGVLGRQQDAGRRFLG